MEKFVDQNEFHSDAASTRIISQLQTANVNHLVSAEGERQPLVGAALRRQRLIDNPQSSKVLDWVPAGRGQPGPKGDALLVNEIEQHLLAAATRETRGSGLDDPVHV